MAVKHLVSGKDGDHLPVTDASGTPDHHLMGAAWAALHGGYRGNKYEGPNKSAAITKLKAMYKAEGMTTPQEAELFRALPPGQMLVSEGMATSDSYEGI